MFSSPESAKESDARPVFQKMFAFAKQHADAMIFTSVDRALRTYFDMGHIEELWLKHGVDSIMTEGDLRLPSRVAAPPLEAKVDRPDVATVELAPGRAATRERGHGDWRVQELHVALPDPHLAEVPS